MLRGWRTLVTVDLADGAGILVYFDTESALRAPERTVHSQRFYLATVFVHRGCKCGLLMLERVM